MNREYRNLILLLLLAAVLFSINLGGYDLWPPDEPRFAQVAREMMQSGDYLVPHINGEPYKEKPPLLFWLMAAVSAPFGDVNEYTARIPSLIAGLWLVFISYLLARRLYGTRVAFWTVVILITAQRVWWQSRFGQIDMLLASMLTTALYCFWRWHTSRRLAWLAAFYLACTAGLYAKGPGTLVFPVLLCCFFFWREKKQWWTMHPILGGIGIVALYSLWMIPARMGAAAELQATTSGTISSDLLRQTIGRFVFGVAHVNGPWYYLETLPADWIPWTFFAPWTLPWVWKRRKEGPEMRFLLCWIIPAFIFFSIAIDKRAIYLLPLSPALAILFARSILDLMDSDRAVWRRRTGLIWSGTLFAFAIAPFAVLFSKYKEAWEPTLIIFSAVAAVCAVHAAVTAMRGPGRTLHGAMAVHFALILATVPLVIYPLVNTHKSVRRLCEPVRLLAESGKPFDLYSMGFTREEYIYYTKMFHKPVFTEISDLKGLEGLDVEKQAPALAKLRQKVAKAVEKVPVSSLETISDAELEALRNAADHAADGEKIDPALWQTFENSLKQSTGAFWDQIIAGGPAFIFIQDRDWRWMVALAPQGRKLHLVHGGSAGYRNVLLVTNDAGQAALNSLPLP